MFAGFAFVQQEAGGGADAEIGAGQLGDSMAQGGEINGATDTGEGEMGSISTWVGSEAEAGAGGIEAGGEIKERGRGLDAGEEHAGVVGIGEPTEAADRSDNGAAGFEGGEGGL